MTLNAEEKSINSILTYESSFSQSVLTLLERDIPLYLHCLHPNGRELKTVRGLVSPNHHSKDRSSQRNEVILRLPQRLRLDLHHR